MERQGKVDARGVGLKGVQRIAIFGSISISTNEVTHTVHPKNGPVIRPQFAMLEVSLAFLKGQHVRIPDVADGGQRSACFPRCRLSSSRRICV